MSRRAIGWLLVVAGLLVAGIALLVGLQRDNENAAVDLRNARVNALVDGFGGRDSDEVERTAAKWQAREDRELTIALVATGAGVILAAVGGVTVATARRD